MTSRPAAVDSFTQNFEPCPFDFHRVISERKLLDCLTALGRDVQIVIKDVSRRRSAGKLTVVFA